MKKTLLTLTAVLLLSGCASQPARKELPCTGSVIKGCQPVLYYHPNSYEISPLGMERLDWAYEKMARYPRYNLKINGFADLRVQNEDYNKRLSFTRAYVAKEYLVGKGIEESRISIEGFGSDQALCYTDNCQGINRRIQLEIYAP